MRQISLSELWSQRFQKIHLFPASLLFVGFVAIIAPCVFGGYLPGGIMDSRLITYLLESFYQSASGNQHGFIDAPFFYPWPDTLGYSDTLWGTAPIYALFRLMGMTTFHAYAAWFAVGNILNFIVAYVVLRRFGLAQLGAGMGAFLFAFSLPVSSQFGHTQLTYRFGVPLAIYFFHRYLTTRQSIFISLVLLSISLQTLATLYLGIFSGYLLVAWFLSWCYLKKVREREAFSHILRNLLPQLESIASYLLSAAIGLVAIALLILALVPYWEVHSLYGFTRDWQEIKSMLPRVQSYLLSDSSMLWAFHSPLFDSLPMRWEHNMFLGSIAVIAAVATTFYEKALRPGPTLFLMRTSFFLLFIVTLCLFGHTLYYGLAQVPGLNAIRSVTRIILVMAFPVGFMLGNFIESIYNRDKNTPWWRLLAIALVIGCVAESVLVRLARFNLEDSKIRTDQLEAQVKAALKRPLSPSDILVVAQTKDAIKTDSDAVNWYEIEIDSMLVAQKLGIKTLNGYSGSWPPGYSWAHTREDVLRDLADAKRFRKNHHFPVININPENLILVGFKNDDQAPSFASIRPSLVLADGKSLTVEKNGTIFTKYLLGPGWSEVEPTLVWTDGDEAELNLLFAADDKKRIYLDLQAFLPKPDSTQRIEITANDLSLGEVIFTQQANRGIRYFDLPPNLGKSVILRITIDNPHSPLEEGLSSDSRDLGVALYGLGQKDNSH
jgi:hypothetical protein